MNKVIKQQNLVNDNTNELYQAYITLKNYGTPEHPQSNVSLQRADSATIINSALSLSGATDRTNE